AFAFIESRHPIGLPAPNTAALIHIKSITPGCGKETGAEWGPAPGSRPGDHRGTDGPKAVKRSMRLDFDLFLLFLGFGRLGQRHGQNALREISRDLAAVDALGQREGALERA